MTYKDFIFIVGIGFVLFKVIANHKPQIGYVRAPTSAESFFFEENAVKIKGASHRSSDGLIIASDLIKTQEGKCYQHPALEKGVRPARWEQAIRNGTLMFSYSLHYNCVGGDKGGMALYRKHCGNNDPQLVYENLLKGRKTEGAWVSKTECEYRFMERLEFLRGIQRKLFGFSGGKEAGVLSYLYHFGPSCFEWTKSFKDSEEEQLKKALLSNDSPQIKKWWIKSSVSSSGDFDQAFYKRALEELSVFFMGEKEV